ncbi:MAG TPA: phosphoenolpyruvate carboxykinase (ATP) [Candidatus Caenarcaniphilales bacterium]|nr:phosphoenolpyruvate carboxykinase (ATP) [Candidatus Caenarcaniphilales bacterium]
MATTVERPTTRPDDQLLGRTTHANLSVAALYERAIERGEGTIAAAGPLVVRTGHHTGRSPNDKFIVDEPGSHDGVWWGGFNQPITEERYDAFRARLVKHLNEREVFVQDCFVGADPTYRRSVRAYTESAWASIFCDNLFIRPKPADLVGFAPNFTIIDAPSFRAVPERDGTRSETAILVHLSRQEILIAGTQYAGEMKKGAFGIMNYRLPDEGVLPMHSSVNVGRNGDVAVFFGLSGTGKTTLSADPERILIGDDEHGWSDDGIFNFEGGCYAKTIRLSHIYEPDIYSTTRRFGTILENVAIDAETRELDLDSDELTENTRGAFPLHFISNSSEDGLAGQPSTVIFLTADAFGVLPPISRLTRDQAMYHFISGYTAKLAGTEVGVKEPTATFSTCFGAPFMPRHPQVYAGMLGERLDRHDVPVWLINTGWTGGPYGVGERMNITYTRQMVRAALNGDLEGVPTRPDPIFGMQVPASCPDVPAEVLWPRDTWADPDAYDRQARKLAQMFVENFRAFQDEVSEPIRAAGPKAD